MYIDLPKDATYVLDQVLLRIPASESLADRHKDRVQQTLRPFKQVGIQHDKALAGHESVVHTLNGSWGTHGASNRSAASSPTYFLISSPWGVILGSALQFAFTNLSPKCLGASLGILPV
jgi:hypothetical protein